MTAARDPTDTEGRLGRLLVERGRLDEAALARAGRVADQGGEPLHGVLVKLGLVAEGDLAEALAEVLGLGLVQGEDYPAAPLEGLEASVKFLEDSRLVPIAETEGGLVVAAADPLDGFAVHALEVAAGRPVLLRVGVPAEIEAALARLYGERPASLGDIVTTDADRSAEADVERLRDLASEAPVIRIVNLLIARAVEARASDSWRVRPNLSVVASYASISRRASSNLPIRSRIIERRLRGCRVVRQADACSPWAPRL
jgi:general secretion pathway protein E